MNKLKKKKKKGCLEFFFLFFPSHWLTDLSYEHPLTTAVFLCPPVCHRSQVGLFGEQDRPE